MAWDGEGVIKAVYGSIVDGPWPVDPCQMAERVANDEQLKAAAAKGQQQIKGWLASRSEQDKFGGWLKGPAFEAKAASFVPKSVMAAGTWSPLKVCTRSTRWA